jgi:hypothetical protein
MWVGVAVYAAMGLLFAGAVLALAWRWLTKPNQGEKHSVHEWTEWQDQEGLIEVRWRRDGGGRSVIAGIEARACRMCHCAEIRTRAAKNQPGWPGYVPEERRERTMTAAK